MRALEVRRLGTLAYADALALQRDLVEERRAGRVPDLLLLLQHPPVITIGVKRDGGRSHVLAPADHLARLGIEVHESGRGGDVTYHGPGQLVGYPILDLRPDRCDVHRYVRDLEDVMLRVCEDYGVPAGRVTGLSGVWVGGRGVESAAGSARRDAVPPRPRDSASGTPRGPMPAGGSGTRASARWPLLDGDVDAKKIGAIGVRISRWITCHGFAFNVSTNLAHFQLIVPCGIGDRGVTSLERVTGASASIVDVEDRCVRHLAGVFGRHVVAGAPEADRSS